jgi:hypothetical protein
MQIRAAYRLRSYRITEYENGLFWWESHFDFGRQRGGECYLYGDILIIKHWSSENDGLLIGEYLDHLKKLPPWTKTRYYCFASELLDIRSGRKLAEDFLRQRNFDGRHARKGPDGQEGAPGGPFKLDRYLITIGGDGSVLWEVTGSLNRILSGRGKIESDILFLEPGVKEESGLSRQQFLERLSQAPPWQGSSAWCRHSGLQPCREEKDSPAPKKAKFHREIPVKPERPERCPPLFPVREEKPPDNKPHKETTPGPPGAALSAFFSRLKKYKIPRPRLAAKKVWLTGLIVLAVAGIIVGVGLAYHALEERFPLGHWFKDRHHHDHYKSRSLLSGFLFLVLLAAFTLATGSARAEEKDIILDSGIHYPGGFDANTVGEVQGKAVHIYRPEKGPMRFQLVSAYGTYTILTCPPWFWNDLRVRIGEGAEVAVRGSKTVGRDGVLYVIAQEVQVLPGGQSYCFRCKDGLPAWRGLRWPGQSAGRESGPPNRGPR